MTDFVGLRRILFNFHITGKDGVAIYNVRRKHKFKYMLFDLGIKKKSSNYRELQALLLLKDSDMVADDTHLIYMTDSSSLVAWVKFGTTDSYAASKLQEIFLHFHSRNIRLSAVWVPRSDEEIVLADTTVRFSSDEFRLPENFMSRILKDKEMPTLDVYASILNHTCEKYYTRYPALGSSGSPGELCNWQGEVLWLFPPKNLVNVTLHRVMNEPDIRGYFVILSKAQNVVERFMLEDGRHLPSYVLSFSSHVTRFRSSTLDSSFLRKRHNVYIIRFDKGIVNNDLSSRCYFANCDHCGGNKLINHKF